MIVLQGRANQTDRVCMFIVKSEKINVKEVFNFSRFTFGAALPGQRKCFYISEAFHRFNDTFFYAQP